VGTFQLDGGGWEGVKNSSFLPGIFSSGHSCEGRNLMEQVSLDYRMDTGILYEKPE